MKGGGKSHITKGVIHESLKHRMSAVVFDVNGEYAAISPQAVVMQPGANFKFRLDVTDPETFLRIVDRLAPFPERTAYAAAVQVPRLIQARIAARSQIPDIPYLRGSARQVITGNSSADDNMRAGYERSLDIMLGYDLFMTDAEAKTEDAAIAQNQVSALFSLRTAFNNMLQGTAQVLVFEIGGLQGAVQRAIVTLVLDHLKKTCSKQAQFYQASSISVPQYPTVYFEEAHMYMEPRDIDELIPVIRHIGINVFFVTNTPGALPDSVFRLVDNLIMARLINRKDVDRVVDSGLADKETIVRFAEDLQEHHALFLSTRDGGTQGFPLVFHVRDFKLPRSGQTRSQWDALKNVQMPLPSPAAPGQGTTTTSQPLSPPPSSANPLSP